MELAWGETAKLTAHISYSSAYQFDHWTVDGVRTDDDFELVLTMGDKDIEAIAYYEYCPEVPMNPGANTFNPETGVLVISDMPRSLYHSFETTVPYTERHKVKVIKVIGDIKSMYSVFRADNLTSLENIDLSRTWGDGNIPDWAFQGVQMKTLSLPESTESLGNNVFDGCEKIADLYVYAKVPPTIYDSTFDGCEEAITVHVPLESVGLYMADALWSVYPIVPIVEGSHSLEVVLPEEALDGRYRNCKLELLNLSSGVRTPLIINDRLAYTYENLLEGEQYSLYMYSTNGLVIGRVNNISIGNSDLSVALEISPLCDVYALIKSPSGQNCTSSFGIEWYEPRGDGNNRLLSRGAEFKAVPQGQKLLCRMTMTRPSVEYFTPTDTVITVEGEGTYIMNKELVPRRKATFFGRVLDQSGTPIKLVNVVLYADFEGTSNTVASCSADKDGYFSLPTIEAAQYRLMLQSLDYITYNDTIYVPEFKEQIERGTIRLSPITGGKITPSFTYTTAHSPEQAPTKTDDYSSYNLLSYKAYNVTKSREIASISNQYIHIVLLDENLSEGDVIRMTAIHPDGAFEPVEAELTLESNLNGYVRFDIVEKGAIQANIEMTDNREVSAQLYDQNGRLVRTAEYKNASTMFKGVDSGSYKLLSIGKTALLTGVQSLATFAEMGMTEGVDYVVNEVSVTNGVVSTINIPTVPQLDENRFLYTENNITTVNKPNVVMGTYVTGRVVMNFKDKYLPEVSRVSLVFDIPDGCQLVPNSLMRGNRLASYTVEGTKVTVPLDDSFQLNAPVWIVFVPTRAGEFHLSACVEFDYQGRTNLQPLGDLYTHTKEMNVSFPQTVTAPYFFVSGNAPSGSKVNVLDGGTTIGETTVMGDGYGSVKCQLAKQDHSELHKLQALVTTPENLKLESGVYDVKNDRGGIGPKRLTMISVDYSGVEQRVVFDYFNPTATTNSYQYSPLHPEFNFLIEFTDPNPALVQAVDLYVYTDAGNAYILEVEYDSKKACWVASADFPKSNDPPVNINVAALYNTPSIVDMGDATHLTEQLVLQCNELSWYNQQLNYYMERIREIDPESATAMEDMRDAIEVWARFVGLSEDLDMDIDIMTMDEYEVGLDAFLRRFPQSEELDEFYEVLQTSTGYGTYDLGGSIIERKPLSEAGVNYTSWESYMTSDNNYIYLHNATDFVEVAYPFDDTYYKRTYPQKEQRQHMRASGSRAAELADMAQTVAYNVKEVINKYSDITDKVAECEKAIKAIKNEREFCLLLNNQAYFDYLKAHGQSSEIKKIIDGCTKSADKISALQKQAKFYKFFQNFGPILSAINFLTSLKQDVQDMYSLYKSVPEPCKLEQEKANAVRQKIYDHGMKIGVYTAASAASIAAEIAGLIPSIATAIPSYGASVAVEGGLVAVTMVANWGWGKVNDMAKANLKFDVASLVCDYDDDDDEEEDPDKDKKKKGKKKCACKTGGSCSCRIRCMCGDDSPFKPTRPIIDPSGYVYEAVPSNRVADVEAAIYYLKETENIYGEISTSEVLWNAEEFGQINPLYTDAEGLYAWDVPAGMWQVRFNKEGYQDTQSEWLPVPPPQLEVNIPMVQITAPNLREAHAYETGIQFQFDKYMDITTLNPVNVIVTVGGTPLEGKVVTLDEEISDPFALAGDTTTPRYASMFRFIPQRELTMSQGEVTLPIKKEVLSYAGVEMESNFSQKFDIEKEITEISTEDPVQVKLGGTKVFTVNVVPFDGAVGKKLHVLNQSSSIFVIDNDEYEIDSNGQVKIGITGELPGQGRLRFSIDNSWSEGWANVAVVENYFEVKAPEASRMSGTKVYYGTKIYLSTDVPNATIYYTLDGSCPCDPGANRLKYVNPIVAYDQLQIKAMVITLTGEESETAEFTYSIKEGADDFNLPQGWSWISHNIQPEIDVETFLNHPEVERILSQSEEAVRQDQNQFTGILKTMKSSSSYKVLTTDAVPSFRIEGYATDPAKAIAVTKGLNWLGYTPNQVMSLEEAFAKTEVSKGDYIVGQRGFAQYDGQNWEGSLTTLAPTQGYLYFSTDDKNIVYNTDIVSKARQQRSRTAQNTTPWAADPYRYPQAMCIIANIVDNNSSILDSEAYSLGAFCQSECRGVGYVINDKYYLMVYGNVADEITLLASDEEGKIYPLGAPLQLTESLVGSVSSPLKLVLGADPTGIVDVIADSRWNIRLEGDILYLTGDDLSKIDQLVIISVDGRRVLSTTSVTPSGINLGSLPTAVYCICINSEGQYSYFKIAKK